MYYEELILLILTEMKKLIITSILAALVTAGTIVTAQDYPEEYLGLPGDNLNLYAVMKLFQESQTLEEFERNLNDENSRINNLDLNGDNLIDYITVNDYIDGNVHTIVLRTALNRRESQDIAVFTVQRFRDGSVQIQLVGDEDLYGRNYIIEPIYDDYYGETPNPGYTRRRSDVTVVRTTYYEVASWPLVRFIFLPDYAIWRSSWYWGYYPTYWHPWHPFYWHYYYGYHYNWHDQYYSHYRHWDHHRYERYNDFYYSGIRSHSPHVSAGIKEGNYRSTYSHPEQRREGEALYTSLHSGQNSGRTANTSVNSQRRRSGSESIHERTHANTSNGAARQPANTINNKPGTDRSSGQNAGASRRQETTSANRPVTKSSESRNSDASGRTKTDVDNRSAAKSSSGQYADAERRSSPNASGKPASRSDHRQRGETARTPGSETKSAGSADHSRSNDTKTRSSDNKSNKSKESDNRNSSRRK
jgi:hypothetical protein